VRGGIIDQYLSFHLKTLEKEERMKPQANRRKHGSEHGSEQKWMKQRTEKQGSHTRICFCGKTSEIDKPLARLTKQERKRKKILKLPKSGMEKETLITIDLT
jgi:hypothetical protein